MTEKPKRRLFSSYLVPVNALFLFLAGLFLFAIFVTPRFFLYISLGLLISIIYLIPVRYRLSRKQSEVLLQIQDIQERMNLVEAEMQHENTAIESFRGKIIDLSKLKDLTERLSMSLTLEDTSNTLINEVNLLFGDEETTIILYLFHSKTGELGISSSHKGQMRVNIKSKKGDEFDQWVAKTMQPLLIEDTKSDYRFDIEKIKIEDDRPIRSMISVPLIVGNKALGIVRIDSPAENHFTTEDLRFLRTIADLGAVAIENAQLYERVEKLAIRDSLTNLYLRRYLMGRLPEEIARHIRSKGSIAFLMLDLDKFKQYNDKFGHVAGDIVLKTLSNILLEKCNRPGDFVCRYGGEEFAVLLPDCKKADAFKLAEEIRKKVESEPIYLRREKTNITVSIGVAVYPTDAQGKEELIHKADDALYRAKENGRNQVCSA